MLQTADIAATHISLRPTANVLLRKLKDLTKKNEGGQAKMERASPLSPALDIQVCVRLRNTYVCTLVTDSYCRIIRNASAIDNTHAHVLFHTPS